MTTTRRDLLTAALTATAAAAVTPSSASARQHDHDHDHDHQAVPPDPALRVKALESLLVAKGLVDRAALDALVDAYEHQIGPRNGARVVARAWVDEAYKQRLLCNVRPQPSLELGYMVVGTANTWWSSRTSPRVHNLIVCTLCSCYPWPVLGLPPVWYKSAAYRSRAASLIRAVCSGRMRASSCRWTSRFALWDSTGGVCVTWCFRERPAGTQRLSEAELAALVTREAMLGVARVTVSHQEARA